MFSRLTRWNWLACFAVFNLVFWIGVAIAIGLLVTDTLDLGVESFIRTQHATAIVVWDKMSSSRLSAPATRTAVQSLPTARIGVLTAPGLSAVSAAASTANAARPTTAATRPVQPRLTSAVVAGPTRPVRPGVQVQNTPIPGPTTQPPAPSPQPSRALLSSPLLVSDPDIGSMAGIDAEMARSAPGRPVQIRYDETTLNRQVTEALARYPDLPYQNLQLDLRSDRVVVKGNVTVMGFQVKAEVQGVVVAQDCMPRAEIFKVSIAGLLTPGFVRDSIEKMILDSLSWYPPDYPLCVEQIVLEEDRVTVYGSRR